MNTSLNMLKMSMNSMTVTKNVTDDSMGTVMRLTLRHGDILNSVLAVFGVKNLPNWLQDTVLARFAVSVVSIWLKVGYYYIIFDAGLKNIPTELYEAADIDGYR